METHKVEMLCHALRANAESANRGYAYRAAFIELRGMPDTKGHESPPVALKVDAILGFWGTTARYVEPPRQGLVEPEEEPGAVVPIKKDLPRIEVTIINVLGTGPLTVLDTYKEVKAKIAAVMP